jgi:hypothetical protein
MIPRQSIIIPGGFCPIPIIERFGSAIYGISPIFTTLTILPSSRFNEQCKFGQVCIEFPPKQLAEPLEFSSKIRPICLSKKGVPEPQKDAIISGWGTYAYNGKKQ